MTGAVKSSVVDYVLVEEGKTCGRQLPGWPAFRDRHAKRGYRSAAEAEQRRVRVVEVILERGLEVPDLRVMRRTVDVVRSAAGKCFEARRSYVPVSAAELSGEVEGAVAVEQAVAEARTVRERQRAAARLDVGLRPGVARGRR